MNNRRVVVTGMGAVTALGLDTQSTWTGVVNGKNGVRAIEHFDASAFSTRFSASLQDFSVEGYIEPRDAKRMDLSTSTPTPPSTMAHANSLAAR